MPTATVIVPVYKVEPYLKKCVDSVLTQTFKDFDLVLVDDGSPDNCGRICDEYAAEDKRIHVIHQKNGGLSAARNAGINWAIANSPSQYITFIDSDDWVDANYLEMLVLGIALGADISCTSIQQVDSNGHAHKFYLDTGWHKSTPDKYWNIFDFMKDCAPGKLIPKRYFEDIRYPEGRLFEDIFTTYKLIFKAKRVVYRDLATYNYLVRGDSITKGGWSPRQLDILDAYLAQINWLRKHGHTEASSSVQNRARAFKWSIAKQLNLFDPFRAAQLEAEVLSEMANKHGLDFFWQNRGVFKEITPCRTRLMWPIAMIWNTLTHRRQSWLFRELLPILRQGAS